MSSTNQNNIINPKSCSYGCSTRIYWNTTENAYFEVFTRKKHVCPNRSKSNVTQTTTSTTKPTYYSKKSYYATQQQPKPNMSNSFELLTGPIANIQRQYETLSDIVTEYNDKVHGSQSHIIPTGNNGMQLITYYEVPEGQRDEIKRKFDQFSRNVLLVYNRNRGKCDISSISDCIILIRIGYCTLFIV